MAYIGNNSINSQSVIPATDFFSGNGVTTAFTLSRTVVSAYTVEAVINNVPQNPSTAYGVSGNTITFTSPPPSGTNNIYVNYNSIQGQVVGIGQGTVGPSQMSTGGPTWDISGNVTALGNVAAAGVVATNTLTASSGVLSINATGSIAIPSGTTAQRSGTVAGSMRYNSTIGAPEQYVNGAWQSLLGTSPAYPAVSASAIYAANPSAPSGYYWIQPAGLSKPFQAYCKMDFGGGWMNVNRIIPEISSSPVLVGVAPGSGASDMVGTDFSNAMSVPMGFMNGVQAYNNQTDTYGCGGGSYPSTIQTTAAFRTYFPTISQCRVKVWIGTNSGNVVCATVSGMSSVTMITGSSNILGICNNTPNRWSDLVGQNQVAEWYGTPQSSTILYTTSSACGSGGFYSRVLELYIR